MSKLINFEYFPSEEENTYHNIVKEINIAVDQGYNSVIGLMLADGFLYKNNDLWNSLYNRVVTYARNNNISIKIVTGMSHDNKVNCQTIPFDFYMHTVYNTFKDKKLPDYDYTTGKFLFLGGVPDRQNRIGLLYDLYKQRLLNNAVWSFFPPWTETQVQNSLQYFNTKGDYDEFIKFAERRVDDLYDSSKHYGTDTKPSGTDWTHDTAWINPNLYQKTSLSIISEGHPGDSNNNSRFLTEKIFRVFVLGHPFLLAANPTIFKYIKELGFKTFEEYFPLKDYGTDYPEEQRLKKLIENLKFFLHNKIDFKKDVEFNRKHFFRLAEQNEKILKSIDADEKQIKFYFDRKGFGHLL